MIQRITEYDLLQMNIVDGSYYFCMDSRKLYVDSDSTRLIVDAVIVNTEADRMYNITPAQGVYYYIWETNELWLYSAGWNVIVGTPKKYNGFFYNNGTLQGKDETTVLDNNGLLKDGSVCIRDINRVIKGRAYINQNLDNAAYTNSLVLSSILGGGIILVPNGEVGGSATVEVLSAGTYVGEGGNTEILDNGEIRIYDADIYVIKDGVKYKVDMTPVEE